MADLAAADQYHKPFCSSSSPNFLDPHLFLDDDLCVPSGGLESQFDLDLDIDGIDWDISVDDLLLPVESDTPAHSPRHSNDGSLPEYGVSTSPSPATSANMNARSAESGHSDNCSAVSGGEVKQEEEEKSRWGTKKRSCNSIPNPRSSKFRRSVDVTSDVFNSGSEEERRKVRLMRNRESAQLSRQRKRHYVEELEEKVRSMHSTIAELNGKISFFMAENASLKQQLVGNGGGGHPPGVFPPRSIAPVHFPWIPYPGLAFRSQGSQVPLVPIPKLKPQQTAAALKTKKRENKKGERKTKKVASITLLGFFFCILVFGGTLWGADLRNRGGRNFGSVTSKDGLSGSPHGMVLSVSGRSRIPSHSEEAGFNNGKKGKGEGDLNRISNKGSQNEKVGSQDKLWESDGRLINQNSSESLPALLYVPRNGKHVKINGNLIISSVLASEGAVANSRNEPKQPSGNKAIETSLTITSSPASGLAVPGRDMVVNTMPYGSSAEHLWKLAPDSEDAKDGHLQQWFQEGLAGQIFSSGTCTEMFQFQIPPSSTDSSAIFPAASIVNATVASKSNSSHVSPPSSAHLTKMYRRFLYPQAIPLPGSTPNKTEHLGKLTEDSGFKANSSAVPMIVSVLADPGEVGDGDGMISSKKSLPRIFVVVLLDSVKYVTYSCVLPFKNSGHHLVN